MIIINEDGKRRRIAEDILNLLEHLKPVAKRLNSYEELLGIEDIIQRGCSAKRQRAVFGERKSEAHFLLGFPLVRFRPPPFFLDAGG